MVLYFIGLIILAIATGTLQGAVYGFIVLGAGIIVASLGLAFVHLLKLPR